MHTWGKLFRITLFGESHGPGIGAVIECPAGIPVSTEEMQEVLSLRKPGQSDITTKRKEEDIPNILSGLYNGFTTGRPVTVFIKNSDTHSSDYDILSEIPRPGHADFPAHIKYMGYEDMRGGGGFSGRLTAPLTAAGYIASKFLEMKGIKGVSFTDSIGNIREEIPEDYLLHPDIDGIKKSTYSNNVRCPFSGYRMMKQEILAASEEKDSVGGTIFTIYDGLMTGMGEPYFSSIESELSSMIFSVPGVKAIEFGAGFSGTKLRGSMFNDTYCMEEDNMATSTNRAGGISGGLSNGMPLVFRCAVRPTSSIGKAQETAGYNGEIKVLELFGRHDPCIVPRAVPVIEYTTAIVLADLYMRMMACG